MSKEQHINLYLPRELFKEFRAACVQRGLSASAVVKQFMVDQLRRWKDE